MSDKEKVIIYCDGACSGNQNKINTGGWGAVLKFNGKEKEIHGGTANTTNQRMELTACIKALEHLKNQKYPVEIYTDSAYLSNGINEKWYVRWRKNGWQNAKKQPVENRDLWEKLLELLDNFNVNIFKVAGHSDNVLNDRADALARKGIDELRNARA